MRQREHHHRKLHPQLVLALSSLPLPEDQPRSHRVIMDCSYRQGSGGRLTLGLIRRPERHLANQKLELPAWGALRKNSQHGSAFSGMPLLLDPNSLSSHGEERNWSSRRMASSSVLNVVARREIPRMSQFGSMYNGINPECCSQTAWVRILAAPVTSCLTRTRDLTSLCLT